jgi:hypothetical protein
MRNDAILILVFKIFFFFPQIAGHIHIALVYIFFRLFWLWLIALGWCGPACNGI